MADQQIPLADQVSKSPETKTVKVSLDPNQLPTGEEIQRNMTKVEQEAVLAEEQATKDAALEAEAEAFETPAIQVGTTNMAGVRAHDEFVKSQDPSRLPERVIRGEEEQAGPTAEILREERVRPAIDVHGAVEATGREIVGRIAGLATGKQEGLVGALAKKLPGSTQASIAGTPGVFDAVLEAINLPSSLTGETLTKLMKGQGFDPDVSEWTGLGVSIAAGIGYMLAVPGGTILSQLGKPESLGPEVVKIVERAVGAETTAMDILAKARYERAAMALSESVAKGEGITFDLGKGAAVVGKEGDYAVSVVPEAGRVFDHAPSQKELHDWAVSAQDLLETYPDLRLGLWEDGGKWYADLSVITDKKTAYSLGVANKQLAIWDFGKMEGINLPQAAKEALAAEDVHKRLIGLKRVVKTPTHSTLADALEAHAAQAIADTPNGTPVFHGTSMTYEKVDPKTGVGGGFWVAEDPKVSDVYASESWRHVSAGAEAPAPQVRPYFLAPDANLASNVQWNDIARVHKEPGAAGQVLRDMGYDGVEFTGRNPGDRRWLIFNPAVLIEKFTGQTAAGIALAGGMTAAAAAADQDNPGSAGVLGAMAAGGVFGAKRAIKLKDAEELVKTVGGGLRYLTSTDWSQKLAANSKPVNALGSMGAAMIFRGEAQDSATLIRKLADRFGHEGILAHEARVWDVAKKQVETALNGLELGPVERVINFFRYGDELPDWYSSGQRVRAAFGPDADMVAGLIAATSAHNSNRRSIEAAIEIYRAYKVGEFDPKDAVSVQKWMLKKLKTDETFRALSMDTHTGNVARAILGQELSGNKVNNYRLAILGDEDAVVIDSHMVGAMLPDPKDANLVPDWVKGELGENKVDWGARVANSDAVYAYFADQVRAFAKEQGVTPRYAQQAIWTGRVAMEGRVEESLTPLADMFETIAREKGLDKLFLGGSEGGIVLASAGAAVMFMDIAAQVDPEVGTTPDIVEAMMPLAKGNAALRRAIVKYVQQLRHTPSKTREIASATGEIAARFEGLEGAPLPVGGKMLAIDWGGDGDNIADTIKKVKELFETEGVHSFSRGVVSQDLEKDMAKELIGLGFDAETAMASFMKKPGANSLEMAAVIALTKESAKETTRILGALKAAQAAGREADILPLRAKFAQQLGRTGQLALILDGQAEEAGRALAMMKSVAGATGKGTLRFAKEWAELGSRGLLEGGSMTEAQSRAIDIAIESWETLGPDDEKISFLRLLGKWGIDLVKEAWYNSLLATAKGFTANMIGNIQAAVLEPMARLTAAGIGSARVDLGQAIIGKPFWGPAERIFVADEASRSLGSIAAMSDAARAAAKSFYAGTSRFQTHKVLPAMTGERVGELVEAAGGTMPTWAHHVVNTIGMTMGAGTRGLLSADELAKVVHFNGELYAMASHKGIMQGLSGEGLSKFMKAYLADVPKDDLKQALEHARYMTFTNKFEPGSVLDALSKVSHSPVMLPFTPFFDVLANITKYEFEWMPGLNMLVKKARQDLMTPGPKQDYALAKLGLGTAFMTSGLALYMSGRMTGPGPSDQSVRKLLREDDPHTKGYQGNAMVFRSKDGTPHYVGFDRMEPVGTWFRFVAAYGDIALEALNGREIGWDTVQQLALAGLLTFNEVFTNQTWMEGYRRFLDAALAQDMDALQKVQAWSKRTAAQAAVPTIFAQISQAVDPQVRVLDSFIDYIHARMPWRTKGLYPAYNAAGEPLYKTPAFGPDWMSPLPYKEGGPDPVTKEVIRLGISWPPLGVSIFGPTPPTLGEENSTHGVKLNAKQQSRYQYLAGKGSKLDAAQVRPILESFGFQGDLPSKKMGMWETLTALIETPAWKSGTFQGYELTGGPDGAKGKIIRSIVQAFRAKARIDLMRGDKELQAKVLEKFADKAEAMGGARAREEAVNAMRTMDLENVFQLLGEAVP